MLCNHLINTDKISKMNDPFITRSQAPSLSSKDVKKGDTGNEDVNDPVFGTYIRIKLN